MLVKLVLLLLSSKMGTFLLCGKASLCWKKKKALPGCGQGYPIYCYARAFPDIPPQEREKILLEAWSHSPKQTFRKLFNAFKIFTSYSYFTKVKPKKKFLNILERKQQKNSKPKTRKQIKAKFRLKSSKFKTKKTLNHFVGFFFFNL